VQWDDLTLSRLKLLSDKILSLTLDCKDTKINKPKNVILYIYAYLQISFESALNNSLINTYWKANVTEKYRQNAERLAKSRPDYHNSLFGEFMLTAVGTWLQLMARKVNKSQMRRDSNLWIFCTTLTNEVVRSGWVMLLHSCTRNEVPIAVLVMASNKPISDKFALVH